MEEKTKEASRSEAHKATSTLAERPRALPNPYTWPPFSPDPMVLTGNVGPIYQFDTMRFTIWENGPVEYTLSMNMTSRWGSVLPGQNPPPPDITIQIKDAAGGVLDTWDIGRPRLPCGTTPGVVFATQNGKANILNAASSVTLIIGTSTFYKC